MPLTSSLATRQLSDANSQGTVLGQTSTDLIGFYGTPTLTSIAGGNQVQAQWPVVGSTPSAQAGAATTLAIQISTLSTGPTNMWGFSTSTQANMIVSTMTALWKMGLIG